MQKINFFDASNFVEAERNDTISGLVDSRDGSMAYSTTEDRESWVAEVENRSNKWFRFVPIDYNPAFDLRRESGDMVSKCGGMIIYDNDRSLAFVELKDVRIGAAADAWAQLESTIVLFHENHDHRNFHRRFAYVANKRHPHFNYSHKTTSQEFYNRLHFRLLEQNRISLIQGAR